MKRHSVLLVAGILSSLSLSSCVTMEVVGEKTRKRHRFAHFTRIERASIAGRELFVEIQTLGKAETRPESSVLRVPLDQARWPEPLDKPGFPPGTVEDDVPFRHLPAQWLAGAAEVPAGAVEVPIHRIAAADLETIPSLIDRGGEGLAVYAIDYELAGKDYPDAWMYENFLPLRQQILAIGGTDAASAPVVVVDVYEGARRKWGWYFLAPFTLVADAITWPVQLILIAVGGD